MQSRYASLVGFMFVTSFLSIGCGDGELRSVAEQSIASLGSCRDGWQALTAPSDSLVPPETLIYRDEELIYGAYAEGAFTVQAQPIAGGDPRVIAANMANSDLWVEGDTVYGASGGQLWQVPVSGGTPSQLVGSVATAEASGMTTVAHLLTPTSFVWWQRGSVEGGTDENEIWSTPRDGSGAPALLGNVDEVGAPERLELVDDAVLAVGKSGRAAVLPLAGGDARILDYAGDWFGGADARGVYTTTTTEPAMYLAGIDGGKARSFWPEMPANIAPSRIWSDEQGGWMVDALEWFDDGQYHRSIFLLDSNEVATRVACDVNPATSIDMAHPAFSVDAAYVVSRDLTDSSHQTWQIVRIQRP